MTDVRQGKGWVDRGAGGSVRRDEIKSEQDRRRAIAKEEMAPAQLEFDTSKEEI